ncbi:phospholipase A1-like [Plodia interpunctella]|uniref:phospholipase A1-like n=1 Tax=Plodia interpunctella TaxID=58824 RepID=UPI0023683B69|nr:phospholipase A1-like [Plodia interpunctella]
MLFVYLLCVPVFFLDSVSAFVSNKTIEGYPANFLPECPGSTNPVVITKKNLKYIQIYITGANGNKRTKYSYDTMDEIANDPSMDWDKPTVFYIPGWLENYDFPIKNHYTNNGPIFESLYKKKGYNVWVLNIFKFMKKEYPVAARAVMAIGAHVAEMLARLSATQPKFDPKKLQLLGASLGGQTMSFIAKSYTKLTGEKIGRLTGLDPSGPCFRNREPDTRLDESDADFVDVIMTNIHVFGMAAPVGHVNFYVNGGEVQPGKLYWMLCSVICSHERALQVWKAAVAYPKEFIAVKCDSVQDARRRNCYDRVPLETNLMGPDTDRTKTGIFLLTTTGGYPYYLGKAGLKKENDYLLNQHHSYNNNDVLRF